MIPCNRCKHETSRDESDKSETRRDESDKSEQHAFLQCAAQTRVGGGSNYQTSLRAARPYRIGSEFHNEYQQARDDAQLPLAREVENFDFLRAIGTLRFTAIASTPQYKVLIPFTTSGDHVHPLYAHAKVSISTPPHATCATVCGVPPRVRQRSKRQPPASWMPLGFHWEGSSSTAESFHDSP